MKITIKEIKDQYGDVTSIRINRECSGEKSSLGGVFFTEEVDQKERRGLSHILSAALSSYQESGGDIESESAPSARPQGPINIFEVGFEPPTTCLMATALRDRARKAQGLLSIKSIPAVEGEKVGPVDPNEADGFRAQAMIHFRDIAGLDFFIGELEKMRASMVKLEAI